MKIRLRSARQDGSVLLVCLGSAIVISLALASYLVAVENENVTVARSQAWNNSMVVAEAGVEDALQCINQFANSDTPLTTWTTVAASEGWSVSGNIYTVTRYVGTNNYYTATINNSGAAPVITATGSALWNNSWGNTPNQLSRAVKVIMDTNATGLYLDGILTRSGVSMVGGITVLSFNSQLPPWNTNSISIIPTTYNANATVATTESNVLAEIDATGIVKIYGDVTTGPNSNGIAKYIDTSGNASVGTANWVNGGSSGVQANHESDTLNITIPPPPAPPANGFALPGSGTVGGTNYDYVFSSATYLLTSGFSMQGQKNAVITGPVTMVVDGNFSMSGQSSIYITPNSTLTVYVNGNASISGNGIANGAGYATNLTIVGLGTNSLSYSGNSAYIGTIDAPYDSVTLTGGGSTAVNFVGSVVAGSANINGGYFFAYDESLGSPKGSPTIYRSASWQEIPPP